jgi:DNA-binding CsgD family transcriptional regulator
MLLMQPQFNITTEAAKLVKHATLAQFSSHLKQLLICSGFNKFIYYALPVNCQVLDSSLQFCTVGLKDWMKGYLLDDYYILDPLRRKLLSGTGALKFQFTSNQAVYQPLTNALACNQDVLIQICHDDSRCMKLHIAADTQIVCTIDATMQPLIDHFIAHDLHQGIGLMLNNYRSMLGIMYLGYAGSSESFTTAYTPRDFAPLEKFIRRWHFKLQDKFVAKFIGKMSVQLTSREQNIIELTADGYTNTQIVSSLGISFSTVRTHINNILAKFQARNMTHACVLALHMGLLD